MASKSSGPNTRSSMLKAHIDAGITSCGGGTSASLVHIASLPATQGERDAPADASCGSLSRRDTLQSSPGSTTWTEGAGRTQAFTLRKYLFRMFSCYQDAPLNGRLEMPMSDPCTACSTTEDLKANTFASSISTADFCLCSGCALHYASEPKKALVLRTGEAL